MGFHPTHPFPHHHHGPCPGGRVKVTGKIELNVEYIDHHGHTRRFPLKQGEMYYIEALSQTKGVCTFIGKIVDFDTVKGIERILEPPHTVSVGALIVDYSTDYEAKIIRIGLDNIIKITPLETPDQVESTYKDHYIIDDPFSEKELEDSIEDMKDELNKEEEPIIPKPKEEIIDPFA